MPEITIEETIEITHDVELWCSTCGAGICSNGNVRRDGRGIDIEPCDKCLEDAKEEARKDVYSQYYDEGYADGIKEG
jgi:hypothetical protein